MKEFDIRWILSFRLLKICSVNKLVHVKFVFLHMLKSSGKVRIIS